MGERLVINEVGPRDGLQSQPTFVPLDRKLELIRALVAAGISAIEATSFVSPKAVPQMADADQLYRALPDRETVQYSALVPNVRGLERARAAGVEEIALVLAATQTMNQRNINMSLAEARRVSQEVLREAGAHGMRRKAYIAVAFRCPFEGLVDASVVLDLAAEMFEAGADEIVIADTIGGANPAQVKSLIDAAAREFDASRLSAHFHDTRGFALANVWASIEGGIRKFDSSIGGLGGCPFAPGAAGNVATEDIVLMAEQSGFSTGIDIPQLRQAVALAETLIGHTLGGHTTAWLRAEDARSARLAT